MERETKRSAGQIILRILFLIYCAVMLWLLFGQRADKSIFNLRLPQASQNLFASFAQNWKIFLYNAALEQNINLTPLATIKLYLRVLQNSADSALLRHAVVNLVGNVVMFVPLGVFLPGIFSRKTDFFRFLLCVMVLIVSVELLQLITLLGSCDVDDLILNLSGAVIGYLLWKIFAVGK